jgi:hypothetical protein
MPSRNMARRHRGGASRRRTTWATHASSEAFAAATDYHTINLLDSYKTAGGIIVGITPIRTILRLTITAGTITAGDALDMGIIRGQDTDVGTNIVGAPDPSAKLFEDWAWLNKYTACAMVGAGPHYFEGGSNAYQLDIRSRRKLPELQMNWNLVLRTSVIATWQVYARTLILLP